LSEEIVLESANDLNKDEFVSDVILSEVEVQSKVTGNIEYLKAGASIQIVSFLHYLRANIRANYIVSALNSNFLVKVFRTPTNFTISCREISFLASLVNTSEREWMACTTRSPTVPVGFILPFDSHTHLVHQEEYALRGDTVLVRGFHAGCTPLEGLLASTLDCLYHLECLRLLMIYFPSINQVRSILSHLRTNLSICFSRRSIGRMQFYPENKQESLSMITWRIFSLRIGR
jgi:hypothetical protein